MTDLVLYGLHYSPWTERARWALDFCAVEYVYREHVPLLGEPLLRWRARQAGRSTATVPLLVDALSRQVWGDSLEIIQEASRRAPPGALSLVADFESLSEWAATIEPALQGLRARIAAGMLASPQALDDTTRTILPGWMVRMSRPLAASGGRFLARKYRAVLDDAEGHRRALRAGLEAVRDALRKSGGDYLRYGRFTAHDIVGATLLQGVQPVGREFIRLPLSLSSVWTHAEFATEYADLVAWRDSMYTRHRRSL